MENLQEIIDLVNRNEVKQLLQKKQVLLNKKFQNSKGIEQQKENKNNEQFRKKESKFLLLKVINNNRLRFIKNPRYVKNRSQIYQFFQNKNNILKLFEHQIQGRTQVYLNFRSFQNQQNDTRVQNDNGVYFKILIQGASIVKDILNDNGLCQTTSFSKPVLFWNNGNPKIDIYSKLSECQKFNHFPNSNQITRKDYMFINIMKIKNKFQEHFDFIPNSFLLPKDSAILMKDWEQNKKKIYIFKPASSSQGKGIFLSNDPQEIIEKSKKFKKVVVSDYIKSPLLINGLKFDLRIYVVVTSVNPLKIYIYQEGLTRFATEPYKLNKNDLNVFTHLTNYSINKKNINYNIDDKQQNSFKWSLTELKDILTQQGIDWTIIFNDIEDICIKTILSIEQKLFNQVERNLTYRDSCFELLGFDILIDEQLKPWLIEVNLAPSLGCNSKLDFDIKSNLIKDLFNLVGIYPKKQKIKKNFKINNSLSIYTTPLNFGQTKYEKEIESQIILETQQEVARSGGFKLLYPSYHYQYYQQFFEENRKNNLILSKLISRNLKQFPVVNQFSKLIINLQIILNYLMVSIYPQIYYFQNQQ